MDSRSAKRKRYSDIKPILTVDLHQLTITSGEFNNDLRMANEDFVQMCKSMADRQSEFLTRSMLLQEKYGEIIAVLKEGKNVRVGESSQTNVEVPPAYSQNVHKFVSDASTSLMGHGKALEEEQQEMAKVFQKYADIWNENMNELTTRGEEISKQRTKLAAQLSDFIRNI